MSQYPSPYHPPNPQPPYLPYGGHVDVLAPAKRASILMFVMGPMLLCCGGCLFSMPFLIKSMPADQTQPMLDKIQDAYHASPDLVFPIMGAIFFLPGVTMLVLAFLVRRGGRVAAILSAVLSGTILLLSLVGLLVAIFQPLNNDMAKAMCMNGLSIGFFGLLLFWLIQAARASSSVQQAQQQYLAQYWQYQQNMQAYSGYGYAAPPQEGQTYNPQSAPTPPPLPAAGNDSSPPPPTAE